MKKYLSTIVSSLLSVAGTAALACPCSEFTIPNPPPETSYELGLNFSKTPAYKKEFLAATTAAKKFCADYKKNHPGETNLAVISDIDETILDNREQFRAHPEKNWDLFDQWVKESKAPVLKPTYEFLSWARKNGFAIIFVTGRPEEDRKATIVNLVSNNISYDALYMRPKHGGPPAEEFKTAVRQDVEKMGFKIVCNIGDQFSDLAGGVSLDCEKLPNKLYFIK